VIGANAVVRACAAGQWLPGFKQQNSHEALQRGNGCPWVPTSAPIYTHSFKVLFQICCLRPFKKTILFAVPFHLASTLVKVGEGEFESGQWGS